jgi:thioredoxin 1
MGKPVEITDQNFEAEVLKSETPALVDFSAEWCPPCRALEPIIEDLVDEYAGRVKIGTVNVDTSRETAGKFGIMSVPTMILFKAGKEADRIVGMVSKENIMTKIDSLL